MCGSWHHVPVLGLMWCLTLMNRKRCKGLLPPCRTWKTEGRRAWMMLKKVGGCRFKNDVVKAYLNRFLELFALEGGLNAFWGLIILNFFVGFGYFD